MSTDALVALVNEYINDKERLSTFKNICENENKRIKQMMEDMNLTSIDSGDGRTLKYVVSNRETFDEDKLLTILKNSFGDRFVATKEYVDMDKLEQALYRNEIPKDVISLLDDCRNVNKVVSLKVVKTKENENE